MPDDTRPLIAIGDRELLRFLTCGSVDDGKSTLIGKLLHEAGLILDDQFGPLPHVLGALSPVERSMFSRNGWRRLESALIWPMSAGSIG